MISESQIYNFVTRNLGTQKETTLGNAQWTMGEGAARKAAGEMIFVCLFAVEEQSHLSDTCSYCVGGTTRFSKTTEKAVEETQAATTRDECGTSSNGG
mgnify:CR=1 FL=1